MTIIEYMYFYIVFSLSGSVVVMLQVFYPSTEMVRALDPFHPILHPVAMVMSGMAFMALSAMTGPLQFMVLHHKEVFINAFVEGLLGE